MTGSVTTKNENLFLPSRVTRYASREHICIIYAHLSKEVEKQETCNL